MSFSHEEGHNEVSWSDLGLPYLYPRPWSELPRNRAHPPKLNITQLKNLILAGGKLAFAARISPPQLRATSFLHPPREAKMLCWLAFGEDEALKRDMSPVGILIPV